jgi:hypothetical protein
VSAAHGHPVQMRWRDLDSLGHVNHTVGLTYLEEGRDAWLADHGIRRDEYAVGRCSVRFPTRGGSRRPGRGSRPISDEERASLAGSGEESR